MDRKVGEGGTRNPVRSRGGEGRRGRKKSCLSRFKLEKKPVIVPNRGREGEKGGADRGQGVFRWFATREKKCELCEKGVYPIEGKELITTNAQV